MSTTLYARTSTSAPLVAPYRGHLPLYKDPSAVAGSNLTASPVDTGPNERQFLAAGVPADFWSGGVVSQHTQTGSLNVSVYGAALAVADADLRLRARLFKITAGGSDVESLIATADASASLTTTPSSYVLTVTIPAAVTLAPGERFIVRFYVFPFTGGWGSGSPVATMLHDDATGPTQVLLPVTVTCADNDGPLYFRRTTTIGVADFFDMTVARGSSTATVNDVVSEAGGTEIQWLRPKQVGSLGVTEITAAGIASTSNAATYVSASFTPVANRLYLLAIVHSDAAPETALTSVTTTTGLNFVSVGSVAFDTIASNVHRLSLFRAMKASGLSAGTYTVTLADAGTGCAAVLTEVTGVVTTGTDGADAIANLLTARADASANPSVPLGIVTPARAFDGVFGCFGSSLQTAPTAGTDYTGLSHPDYATPASGLFAQYRLTSSDTAACTLASSAWAGIACHLVANSTPVGLEWISPRFKAGWAAETADQFAGTIWAGENLASGNCAFRVKVFRRQPDGTETLIYTQTTTELAVPDAGVKSFAGGSVTPTFCAEDDRLVLRAYIANVGTMGAGATCSLWYDHDSAGNTGDSFLTFVGLPEWKAEGDPPAGPTPSTMTMGGVGS